ncbi:uncharacterized protein LOC106179473 [Lingula anatina]|uniref:Uncharacterized protein LOC106179473 n=1 Tax=Lingula anatina TaxID=7574 RepID=A0A1S3K7F7_LINAN|nr:uncharacterized protein LOC106179473 [Lingula anatina]|eukprot:XP_013418565.1 uncharacterized protein LOC106179473 [Lingula anatina]
MSVLLMAGRKRDKGRSNSASESEEETEDTTEYISSGSVKMWTWTFDGDKLTIIFRKDTMEVWVDDDKIDPTSRFSGSTVIMDFKIGKHQARIRSTKGDDDDMLTIDGIPVD